MKRYLGVRALFGPDRNMMRSCVFLYVRREIAWYGAWHRKEPARLIDVQRPSVVPGLYSRFIDLNASLLVSSFLSADTQ